MWRISLFSAMFSKKSKNTTTTPKSTVGRSGGNAWDHAATTERGAPATMTPASQTDATAPIVVAPASAPADAPKQRPSVWMMFLRLLQMIASVGAVGFFAGALPYSQLASIPASISKASTLIYATYAVGAFSFFWALSWFMDSFTRCCWRRDTPSRACVGVTMLVDIVLTAAWVILAVLMIANYACKPGTEQGYCNFYNTGIFFQVLGAVSFALSVGWALCCGCCRN